MIFFTLCIAPIINNTLDRENASKLLRKVFPKNFLFGLVLSALAILVSFLLEQNKSLIVAIFLTCLFLVNLYYIMPKINAISDKDKKRKQYSKSFKNFHLFSVVLYLFKMLASIIGIILTYN
jgi:Ca2+/Na+ antiporter